jgi:phosphoribosylformylglycinamidine (FGAM) synthase-like amidotransferase family enzyme
MGESKKFNDAQVFVAFGEGIQCENETLRFFQKGLGLRAEARKVPLVELYSSSFWKNLKFNESRIRIFVFPGGFSYADHFQSGKLLAFKLRSKGVLDNIVRTHSHALGICNGFQALVQSGIFGESSELLNNKQGHFVDRWVQLRLSLGDSLEPRKVYLPVRHGEGNFQANKQDLAQLKPFLTYSDPFFDNGSHNQIAGVYIKKGDSTFWGMMPHPEIALRVRDTPLYLGAQFGESVNEWNWNFEGDGFVFLNEFMETVSKGKTL